MSLCFYNLIPNLSGTSSPSPHLGRSVLKYASGPAFHRGYIWENTCQRKKVLVGVMIIVAAIPVARQHLASRHVNSIYVRTLFSVYFDRYIIVVYCLGHLFIFKALRSDGGTSGRWNSRWTKRWVYLLVVP